MMVSVSPSIRSMNMASKKFDIGIDPDCEAHGVAVYNNSELVKLFTLSLPHVLALRKSCEVPSVNWHIENVLARNKIFGKEGLVNRARSIGRCQQSQHELEHFIAYAYPNDVIYRYDISKEWKDQEGKKVFQHATKWPGQSNEDTRSAAYFGFLGCKQARLAI